MSLFEAPRIDPAVPVREQLFEAVHTIAATDGPLLFDRQTSLITEWNATYGDIAFRNLTLSRPLYTGTFDVLSADIFVSQAGEDSAISIVRDSGEHDHRYDYDTDFIARDVLKGLLRYIDKHPHSSCIGFYRGLRLRDKGHQVAGVA